MNPRTVADAQHRRPAATDTKSPLSQHHPTSPDPMPPLPQQPVQPWNRVWPSISRMLQEPCLCQVSQLGRTGAEPNTSNAISELRQMQICVRGWGCICQPASPSSSMRKVLEGAQDGEDEDPLCSFLLVGAGVDWSGGNVGLADCLREGLGNATTWAN